MQLLEKYVFYVLYKEGKTKTFLRDYKYTDALVFNIRTTFWETHFLYKYLTVFWDSQDLLYNKGLMSQLYQWLEKLNNNKQQNPTTSVEKREKHFGSSLKKK